MYHKVSPLILSFLFLSLSDGKKEKVILYRRWPFLIHPFENISLLFRVEKVEFKTSERLQSTPAPFAPSQPYPYQKIKLEKIKRVQVLDRKNLQIKVINFLVSYFLK